MLVLRPLLGGGWNDGFDPLDFNEASLVAQTVKNLPAMLETWVQSLSQEDPLEKEMTTHSTIHAWRIPWTEEPDGYSPWGHKELDTTVQLTNYRTCSNPMLNSPLLKPLMNMPKTPFDLNGNLLYDSGDSNWGSVIT